MKNQSIEAVANKKLNRKGRLIIFNNQNMLAFLLPSRGKFVSVWKEEEIIYISCEPLKGGFHSMLALDFKQPV